ncbi:hypothetical protein AGMMS50268_24640 [Spirochaetia bacterium]|nr:hypothetical protein AGMMS50268_24640 [Spirochaetia bacterium]
MDRSANMGEGIMNTIDEYIVAFEPEIQRTLIEIRNFIKNEVPDATEKGPCVFPWTSLFRGK